MSALTLKRYVKKKKETDNAGRASPTYEPNYKKSLIFTNAVADYLEVACKLHYGLTTPNNTREFVYQFAVENNISKPQKWEINKRATYDWFYGSINQIHLSRPLLQSYFYNVKKKKL